MVGGNLDAQIEQLLNVEKQMRRSGDMAGTKKASTYILEFCFKAGAWKTLNDQIIVLSKCRGQLKQLENYVKMEKAKIEELIKAVADSCAKVIVSGAAIGEMALHFWEHYKLMVLKISSKFELRRFWRTVGAVAMLKFCQPNPDDLGYVDCISIEEIAGVRVTIVKNEEGGNFVSTVLLRASTDSILDDLERAVDDGVNTCKG